MSNRRARPQSIQPCDEATALTKASLLCALCAALAFYQMRRRKTHSNQDSTRSAHGALSRDAMPDCKFGSLSEGPGTDALLAAIGAESVIPSTKSESSGCLFMFMGAVGETSSQRDRAIEAMDQGDNNELFILLVRKARRMARNLDTNLGGVLRMYTLAEINRMNDDSYAASESDVPSESDGEPHKAAQNVKCE